ncbi:hypothetical protein Tco_0139281 [Tanacetum coccineum]
MQAQRSQSFALYSDSVGINECDKYRIIAGKKDEEETSNYHESNTQGIRYQVLEAHGLDLLPRNTRKEEDDPGEKLLEA